MYEEDVTRAFDRNRDTPSITANAEEAPREVVIGHYRLIEKLGEGGMGQVWLAEQTAPVRRIVAFKLIKVGIYDDEVLRRFESERQSLAMMDHPAIAKVFDAGTTPEGQPYFVMEYVRGIPITDYCNQKKLTIRERLLLFVQVCEGVQHAHRKTIIHRDLKPANILVTEVDGKPVPRIIDFGLAKATSSSLAGDAMVTRAGVFLGTPGYMSPEQAVDTQDVDTRTDVYSLGVILYELLTGSLPIDVSALSDRPVLDALRYLSEAEPQRPSTKVRTERQSSQHAECCGLAQPAQLQAALNGDLDWITLKSMERDRGRRYDSPSDLAADVLRYLNHEPIAAHPASTGYRIGKYVRRHRVAASIASGLVLLLAAFAAAQVIQLRRITRERDRANRITSFMTAMFKVSDPSESRGNTITVREILDKASGDVQTGLGTDPEVQAALLSTMSDVYLNLGLQKRAEPLAAKSLEIRRRVLGPEHPDTLKAEYDEGYLLKDLGRYDEAERLLRETVAKFRKVNGPDTREEANALSVLSLLLQARTRYAEAEQYGRQAVAIFQKLNTPNDRSALVAKANLATLLEVEAKFTEAESLQRDVLERERRVFGADSPDTLQALENLAVTLRDERRFDESERFIREAIAGRTRVLGAEHPDTLESMSELAIFFTSQGRAAEATRILREVLAIQTRTGREPDAAYTKYRMILPLSQQNRLSEAEQVADEALSEYRKTDGPDGRTTLNVLRMQGVMFRYEGRYADSERVLRDAIAGFQRIVGAEHPDTLTAKESLFNTLIRQPSRRADAYALGQELLELRRRVWGENDPATAAMRYNVGCLAALSGKRDEALRWLTDAVHHGLPPSVASAMDKDTDLVSLHGDPRFEALVTQAKAVAPHSSQ